MLILLLFCPITHSLSLARAPLDLGGAPPTVLQEINMWRPEQPPSAALKEPNMYHIFDMKAYF